MYKHKETNKPKLSWKKKIVDRPKYSPFPTKILTNRQLQGKSFPLIFHCKRRTFRSNSSLLHNFYLLYNLKAFSIWFQRNVSLWRFGFRVIRNCYFISSNQGDQLEPSINQLSYLKVMFFRILYIKFPNKILRGETILKFLGF